MKKILPLFLMAFLLPPVLRADGGATAAPFLKLGAGARAAGMGEAFTAVADDATALTWNPAGLTGIERRSAALMHASYVDSSAFDYAAFGRSFGESAAAVGVQRFTAGSLDELDTAGFKTGSFTPSDMALSAGYARRLGGASWGVAGKYVRSTVVDSAAALALDAGVLSPAFLSDRLRLGAALVNVGGRLDYGSVSEPLPAAFRAGISFRLTESWLAAADAVLPRDGDGHAGLGTEYQAFLGRDLSGTLRAGYSTRASDVEGSSGFSFGAGFGFRSVTVDYGFVPYGDLAATHRVSLSFRF